MRLLVRDLKNILIVRTDRIGDVVLTIPAIRAVKKAFPNARVTVWVAAMTKDLVSGLSFVDEVITEDLKTGWFGYMRLVMELMQRKFDCAIIYHTKRRTNMACALAGIPMRLGYLNDKGGKFLTHPIKDERHLGLKHESLYCLQLLEALDIHSNDVALQLPFQPEAEAWVQDLFDKT
ncbi:MAG: glycosyltransferase family 9 protein, partial [Candidatus Omnitrophica bacterium]|nr:glycosyltransferase family 9 protein [Candidatus Omnitrophota bacterium]